MDIWVSMLFFDLFMENQNTSRFVNHHLDNLDRSEDLEQLQTWLTIL